MIGLSNRSGGLDRLYHYRRDVNTPNEGKCLVEFFSRPPSAGYDASSAPDASLTLHVMSSPSASPSTVNHASLSNVNVLVEVASTVLSPSRRLENGVGPTQIITA